MYASFLLSGDHVGFESRSTPGSRNETVRVFTPFIPIRTIDTKTRLAKRLVADGGFTFI